MRPDTSAWKIVNKDTVYWSYAISCDGVLLGNLYNETDKNFPIAVGGQSCTLNDYLNGIVDITCGSNTYTITKKQDGRHSSTYFGPELVSCKDTDLWCHNPIIDGANSTPVSQITYKEAEGFFFGSEGTRDLTDWGGICITYTSDKDVDIILDLGETKNQELNNNLPQVSLQKNVALPIDFCFDWGLFKQPRWGSPAISGKDAAKNVASFKIKQPSEANFKLVRLRYFRDKNSSSGHICGDMWCADEMYDIIRETGCGKEEFGTWKATTDASSSVIWPEELGSEYDPNSVLPVMEYFFSVAGTFILGNTEKPYAKIGFDLDYESTQNFDITQWGGFCFTYKSTHDFYAELTPYKPADGQEVPRVLIPKSLEGKTVDLTWSMFNPADASSVNFINFVFSEPAGATGYFAFFTVGKPGTCTR